MIISVNPTAKSVPNTLKTAKSIIVVLFVLLTAQIASAYYCPATGRWLSRDPIDESGFQTSELAARISPISSPSRWINRNQTIKLNRGKSVVVVAASAKDFNAYAFLMGQPPNMFDALGLKTCEEICSDARKDPSINNSQGELGGVVCFDGKKCPCVFDYPKSQGFKRSECPAIDQIVLEHEQGHIDRGIDCDTSCGSPTRGRYPKGHDSRKEECDLKKQDIAKLDKLSKTLTGKCAGDAAALKAEMEFWVDDKCK